jgi:hypothetical protein
MIFDSACLPRAWQCREFFEICARVDGDYARQLRRFRGVDAINFGVSMWAAEDGNVGHAG